MTKKRKESYLNQLGSSDVALDRDAMYFKPIVTKWWKYVISVCLYYQRGMTIYAAVHY